MSSNNKDHECCLCFSRVSKQVSKNSSQSDVETVFGKNMFVCESCVSTCPHLFMSVSQVYINSIELLKERQKKDEENTKIYEKYIFEILAILPQYFT